MINSAQNLASYKKLIVYQKAKLLVLAIYKLTEKLPKSEIYGLTPQIRRAAVSILANIVEGYSKDSSLEFARFLTISIGSLTELEVHLDICAELNFTNPNETNKILNQTQEVKKLLYATRKSVRERRKV